MDRGGYRSTTFLRSCSEWGSVNGRHIKLSALWEGFIPFDSASSRCLFVSFMLFEMLKANHRFEVLRGICPWCDLERGKQGAGQHWQKGASSFE